MPPNAPTKTTSSPLTQRPGSTAIVGPISLQSAMAQADPAATAASLIAALPDSLTATLEPVVSRTFPTSGETQREFLRFQLTAPVPDQDRSQALALVKQSLNPMAHTELAKMLVTMRVTTRSKAESSALVDLQLEVYAQKLQDWPADVVRSVLAAWPDTNVFWPSWAELVALMEPLTRKRRALLEVLEGSGAQQVIG